MSESDIRLIDTTISRIDAGTFVEMVYADHEDAEQAVECLHFRFRVDRIPRHTPVEEVEKEILRRAQTLIAGEIRKR